MFQRPELGRNQEPQPPVDRRLEITLQSGRVISGIAFLGTALTGLESLFGDQDILNVIVERTGNIPTSLGAMIIEWRSQGFSDEMISAAILGISGFFLVSHIGATAALNRIRRRR
jgi:hypothetical protein